MEDPTKPESEPKKIIVPESESRETVELEKEFQEIVKPEEAAQEIIELVIPTWRLVALSISLCFGLFLSLLDTTIVATALYAIGVDFESLTSVTWVALAYTLAYVGCAVIFARIGDVVGRRNAYMAAFIIFFAFSLGCGFTTSLNQLIACRALQGVGGSGLYSLTFVIFPEISPPKMRQFIGSMAGMVVAIAGVLGPVLGGLIIHYTTWRWIFWLNAPVGIIPLILFCIAWPKSNRIRQAQRQSFRQLDFIGCVLLIAASVLVVFSFQEGGIGVDAWGTALFIAPLVLGLVCWVLLFSWEAVIARLWEHTIAAMFPLRLLKRRVYVAGVLATMLTGFPYFVVIYSLPLHFQVVNGKSALLAGVGLLPLLGSAAVASMVGGIINGKKNRVFETLMVGACLMLIGTACLSTLSNTLEPEPKVYGFQVFVGLGFGLTVSTVSLLAAVECEIRDHAVSQGIVAQVRVFGGSIGIAATTAILGVTQRSELVGVVTPAQLLSLESSAGSLSPAQLQAVRQAYSDAFDESLRACAIIAGVCILITLGTYQRKPLSMNDRRQQQLIEDKISKQSVTSQTLGSESV